MIVDSKDERNLTPEKCKDWWEKKVADGYFAKGVALNIGNHFTAPAILKKVPLKKDSSVLELGCGCGRQITYFVNHYKDVHGIDVSETAIELTKKRVPEATLTAFDGTNIPYPDNTFDFVTSVFVLQHMKKDNARFLLKESMRVLKEGGYFLHEIAGGVHIPGKEKENIGGGFDGIYNNGYTIEEIEDICKELNLNVQWIETIDFKDKPKVTEGALNHWLCVKK